MKHFSNQGKLIIWKDSRGFGFIKPDEGGKKVFLHISLLQKLSRRPKVGDIILYEQIQDGDGKIRATKATIQGVKACNTPNKRKGKTLNFDKSLVGALSVLLTILAFEFYPSISPSLIQSITRPKCKIKGNISVGTGKKIYHLPNMKDYSSTIIDPMKGEKWFCTESEAISSGWSKAPI